MSLKTEKINFILNSLSEIDQVFLKSIDCLYSSEYLTKGNALRLQSYLQDAIRAKSGISKDFTSLISPFVQSSSEEYQSVVFEDTRGSNSDNELELDLLKDDLMCIVCQQMDVGAGNRLLECTVCHDLYHQECHKPVVTQQDSFESWICQKCKDSKISPEVEVSSTEVSSTTDDSIYCEGGSGLRSNPRPLMLRRRSSNLDDIEGKKYLTED